MTESKIVVIGGTTASGKSNLAIELAKKYNGIVINADSRQIYRDLNIGTAKPIPQKINKDGTWYIDGVPHYLFGFASLESDYNIYKYQKDVEKLIAKFKDQPIFLVGGTGLYIDCVIHGYILPQTNDEQRLELSVEQMQEMIGEKINELNESDRSNPRRLQMLLKRDEDSNPQKGSPLNYLYLVLDVEKEILEQRINERVEKMFENGLVEENTQIHSKYPNYELKSLDTIGYKEFKEYFDGTKTIEEVKELVKIHTRQYAKRQRTWFKRNIEAIHISNLQEADQAVGNFLR